MANVTSTIYDIVCTHDGIKCIDIADKTNIPLNHVSGILSSLKLRNMVFNEARLWYATTSVGTIKRKLTELHESLNISLGEWAEGYVSALTDYSIIDDNGFDELIEWINTSK